MASPWLLDDALKLVRVIQPTTKEFGFHIALGGGVLNTGRSFKDLDLYFLPLNNGEFPENVDGLLLWLDKMWGTPATIGDKYDNNGEMEPSRTRSRLGDESFWRDRPATIQNIPLSRVGQMEPPSPRPPGVGEAGPYQPIGSILSELETLRNEYLVPAPSLVQESDVRAAEMRYAAEHRAAEAHEVWARGFDSITTSAPSFTPQTKSYRHKLKFTRASGDRIDVFIV